MGVKPLWLRLNLSRHTDWCICFKRQHPFPHLFISRRLPEEKLKHATKSIHLRCLSIWHVGWFIARWTGDDYMLECSSDVKPNLFQSFTWTSSWPCCLRLGSCGGLVWACSCQAPKPPESLTREPRNKIASFLSGACPFLQFSFYLNTFFIWAVCEITLIAKNLN